SCDQAMRVFAADPDASKPMQLEVKWRNGTHSTITNIQVNRIYEVNQAGAIKPVEKKDTEVKPFFKDVSALLGHMHVEDAFDDWAQQPSLPRRLSRLGPGVAWYDVDGDGWEDLIVVAAKGGKLGVFLNDKGKGFRALEGTPVADADQGAVLGWSTAGGKRSLLVAVSNFGMKSEAQSELAVYSPTNLATPLRLAGRDCPPRPRGCREIRWGCVPPP